jgi:hypothetical protein
VPKALKIHKIAVTGLNVAAHDAGFMQRFRSGPRGIPDDLMA